jgi:hypothetical protein
MVFEAQREAITPEEMLGVIQDWIAGCPQRPGNFDVAMELIRAGVEGDRLKQLGELLAGAQWSPHAVGKLVCELLGQNRRVRAAIVLHGMKYHGLRCDESRRDIRDLHSEARELVQREILNTVQGRRNGHG